MQVVEIFAIKPRQAESGTKVQTLLSCKTVRNFAKGDEGVVIVPSFRKKVSLNILVFDFDTNDWQQLPVE